MAILIEERSRLDLLAYLQSSGLSAVGIAGVPSNVRIDLSNEADRPQAVSLAAAWDWSQAAQQARDDGGRRTEAKSNYAATDANGRGWRAIAKTLLNEINLLRERLTAQDTAVAAATSLADLKSRWATVVSNRPMPDRTMAQVQTAVNNAIDANA